MKKYTLRLVLVGVGFIGGYLVGGIFNAGMNKESDAVMTGVEMNHASHALLEIDPQLPVPEVSLEVLSDKKDGYNLHINTKNFTFTPEKVNEVSSPNTGHAHIFINGTKLTRVYSGWYYVSSDTLKAGENIISVTLNANDHSEWTKNGAHIESTVKVFK